jgi:hypothetical protein
MRSAACASGMAAVSARAKISERMEGLAYRNWK